MSRCVYTIIYFPHICWWYYVSISIICITAWKKWDGLHQIPDSSKTGLRSTPVTTPAKYYLFTLWDCNPQRCIPHLPRYNCQGLFFPLHPMYMEKNSGYETTNPLQEQQPHQNPGSTTCSSALGSNRTCSRHLAQCTWRYQPGWYQHQYRVIYWLCHRVLGSKSSTIWNHFDTDGPRTTNHLEGWHHKLKNHVAHPHPNIFYLINLLKEQQASTEIKLIQYSAGGKRVPRKGKYVEIDNRLVNLKRRLRNNLITHVNYADAASHLLHLEWFLNRTLLSKL